MKFYNVHCPYCDVRLWSFRLMVLVSLISVGMLVFVIGIVLAAES